MLFKDIQMIDPTFQVLENMTVAVKGGVISYIGPYEGLPAGEDWGEAYDGRGRLLIPGLYNIHCHTPMTLQRGLGENMSLQDWLTQKIFPFEERVTPNDLYFAYLLGVAEMLRFGTVSCTDMYFFGDSMARAVIDSGIKSNLSIAVTNFDDEPYDKHPKYQENLTLLEKYHLGGGGRFKLDLSLHAEYTSTPKVAAGLAAHCKSLGLNMHVHVSETKLEHEECKSRHDGKTPVRYLCEQGIFDIPATAAHCVWVEDSDLDIMADKGVTVASCPVSNLKLASGIFPAHKAMARGVNIGLGTDSVASNNNLNLFEELKLYAMLHKAVTGDPTLITPEEAFACATVNGARAQGRMDCGSIAIGHKADLVVIDAEAPNMLPCHNQLYNLVYAATGSEVVLTMVDGAVLYRDGKWPTLDIAEIKKHVNASCDRILKELGDK
ncbi:MAG: amidohydrolase [Peptococcaceae bacterium]|jgi:5-methylthioadenosine/S-adenosylhomocysteine deaminase|nr:amidohydrolase [Peptococcaceae bacterium]